jgi:hypothetical protein
MKKIEFLFYKDVFKWYDPRNVSAYLIRVVTNSEFNHVAVKLGNVIYQSQAFKGVHRIDDKMYKRRPKKALSLFVDDKTFLNIKILMDRYVGIKYDYLCVFGFVSGRRIESIKRLYCSEYANLIFYELLPKYCEFSKTLISPKDFFNRIIFFKLGLTACNQ